MQGVTVVSWATLGTILLRRGTEITIWPPIFISTIIAFFAGYVALYFWEWVYKAHANSVEKGERYNFGILVVDAASLVVATVGVSFQLYKG